jgi:hypothetical protein
VATNVAVSNETLAETASETPANLPEEAVFKPTSVTSPPISAEKVITSETTTTVNAVPFELGNERPKKNRLPAAFGSAQ